MTFCIVYTLLLGDGRVGEAEDVGIVFRQRGQPPAEGVGLVFPRDEMETERTAMVEKRLPNHRSWATYRARSVEFDSEIIVTRQGHLSSSCIS